MLRQQALKAHRNACTFRNYSSFSQTILKKKRLLLQKKRLTEHRNELEGVLPFLSSPPYALSQKEHVDEVESEYCGLAARKLFLY